MNRSIDFNVRNISLYIIGFFVLGLGVVLMLRANLGAGPFDTVTANGEVFIDKYLFNVTKGMVSFVIAISIMFVIVFTTKKWVLFAMIIPSLIISSFIDFWDMLVLSSFEPTDLLIRILVSLVGGILIPFGLSLIIASQFPAGIFDELTIFITEVTSFKSIAKVRLVIETTGITLGLILGSLAGIGFGDVGIASLIVVITLPSLLEFFLRKLGAFDE